MHFAILQLALSTLVTGPGDTDSSEAKTYSGRAADTEITTPAVARAQIDIDGRLDDPAWQQAALLTSFTQFRPVEGVADTAAFGSNEFEWNVSAPGWGWARVAVWDVAANGAFVNPTWR